MLSHAVDLALNGMYQDSIESLSKEKDIPHFFKTPLSYDELCSMFLGHDNTPERKYKWLPYFGNNICLYCTGLGYKAELALASLLGGFVYPYTNEDIPVMYSPHLRNALPTIERRLKPLLLLEGLPSIIEKAKTVPQAKVYVTSSGFYRNHVFAASASMAGEGGATIVVSPHSPDYPFQQHRTGYEYDRKVADLYPQLGRWAGGNYLPRPLRIKRKPVVDKLCAILLPYDARVRYNSCSLLTKIRVDLCFDEVEKLRMPYIVLPHPDNTVNSVRWWHWQDHISHVISPALHTAYFEARALGKFCRRIPICPLHHDFEKLNDNVMTNEQFCDQYYSQDRHWFWRWYRYLKGVLNENS